MKKKNLHLFYKVLLNKKSFIYCDPKQKYLVVVYKHEQKQRSKGVLRKRCSENMQEIYRRTTMLKCDFIKFAKQLY